MRFMERSLKQKVFAVAAVSVVLAGASFAAVSATGQSTAPDAAKVRRGAIARRARDLADAASYLGISTAQLSSELSSGKTLAQLANASGGGRSAQGLIDALVAARRARLAATAAKLPQRIATEVNRPGPRLVASARHRAAGAFTGDPAARREARLKLMFAGPTHLGDVAASYLGVSPSALEADLRTGKTLAEVANSTPGKNEAGLIAALVTARHDRLQALAGARHLDSTKLSKRLEKLPQRMTKFVQRHFAGDSAAGG